MKAFLAGMAVGLVLVFGIGKAFERPLPEPLKYTEFRVDTILSEPDTVVQFVERIIYP